MPRLACGSPHCVTVGMSATSPGGRTVLIELRYCWPSGRCRFSVKVLLAPPWPGSLEVLCTGENGGAGGTSPPAAVAVDGEFVDQRDRGVAGIGDEGRSGRSRAAVDRIGEVREQAAVEGEFDVPERPLRLVGEGRGQLSCGEIGLDAAFEADELAVASRFHGDVDLVRRPGDGARRLLAEEDLALERFGRKAGHVQHGGADRRVRRARHRRGFGADRRTVRACRLPGQRPPPG